MAKILDPDTLVPKRPSASVQDYLASKYASLKVCSEADEPNARPEGNEPSVGSEGGKPRSDVSSRKSGDPLPPPRPPASEKKREANRRNAQRSTGPKTPGGQSRRFRQLPPPWAL
mgnify:CR=1 FL=1